MQSLLLLVILGLLFLIVERFDDNCLNIENIELIVDLGCI